MSQLSTYHPLPSVWEGEDWELLGKMLDFYPRTRPQRILDATVNAGRFWKNNLHQVVGLDLDPSQHPMVVGDNCKMPFGDECFDVVVYDPPHVPNQGLGKCKDFKRRFGLNVKSSAATGYSLSFLYPPFLAEAYRVLRPEGVVLAKIADYVHNHRFHWAYMAFVQMARAVGFCPCDSIVKIRKGPITSPKWKSAHHARRQHCYWIVLRKSNKCE